MDTSDTRDFSFTLRSDVTQRYFNALLLERARKVAFACGFAMCPPYAKNPVSKPFLSPESCRLTGGTVRGIVDPKEDPYDGPAR